MAKLVLARVAYGRAAELCQHLDLEEASRALLAPELPPAAFLERLLDHGREADAMRFVAHGLPKREAVWWGCLCIRMAGGVPLPMVQEATLTAIVRWVLDPTEANRQATVQPANAATTSTPVGCIAQGVVYSGGSILAEPLPPTPPDPFLTAQVVSGGILLAVARADALERASLTAEFLSVGIEVANGRYLWKSAVQPPATASAAKQRT